MGVASILGAGYVVAGLPIPATQAFVRAEVASVSGKIDGLTIVQLELQRRQIVPTRARADAMHRLALGGQQRSATR